MIKISYDKERDVLEIRFSDDPISDSEYLEESGLVVDYDDQSRIIGLEMISFSRKVKRSQEVEAFAV